MMITTKTMISFRIPDEYVLSEKFNAQHPDWIGFTKQETYAIDAKDGEEE